MVRILVPTTGTGYTIPSGNVVGGELSWCLVASYRFRPMWGTRFRTAAPLTNFGVTVMFFIRCSPGNEVDVTFTGYTKL